MLCPACILGPKYSQNPDYLVTKIIDLSVVFIVRTFNAVPTLTLEQRYHITTDSLVLECSTRGLPSTATLWSRDGELLSNDFTELTTLSDSALAHYTSTLALPEGVFGVVSCGVYSDWVTADKRNSGRLSE